MGQELADNRPDGSTNGREWRTAHFGNSVGRRISRWHTVFHDGCTVTLQAAIRAHGGDAQKTKEAFFNLPETDQQVVIAFINSL
ncbi:MAG: hypothetical protein OXD54_13135 [Candidatus Poribacteria bacterium]|nr:hypothetical protein [Candidatus Poribacteria bacterium]